MKQIRGISSIAKAHFGKVCTHPRCATYMGWITEHTGSNEKSIGKGIHEKGPLVHMLRSRKYLVLSCLPFLFLVERPSSSLLLCC